MSPKLADALCIVAQSTSKTQSVMVYYYPGKEEPYVSLTDVEGTRYRVENLDDFSVALENILSCEKPPR